MSQTHDRPHKVETRESRLGPEPPALVQNSPLGLPLRSELLLPQTSKIWGSRCPGGKGFLNSYRSNENTIKALMWPRRCEDQRKPTRPGSGDILQDTGLGARHRACPQRTSVTVLTVPLRTVPLPSPTPSPSASVQSVLHARPGSSYHSRGSSSTPQPQAGWTGPARPPAGGLRDTRPPMFSWTLASTDRGREGTETSYPCSGGKGVPGEGRLSTHRRVWGAGDQTGAEDRPQVRWGQVPH